MLDRKAAQSPHRQSTRLAKLGFRGTTALFDATTADSIPSNRFRLGSNLSYSLLALA
jgi:hypothetical protein